PFGTRPVAPARTPASESRRRRLAVAIATLGIAATLLAYAVSPGVRHAVSHAAHSVKHAVSRVLDHDTVKRAPAKHPASTNPRAALPPTPRAPPTLQTLAWALAPTWFMDRCARSIGDAFTITFAPSGMKMVLVSDPEAVKQVFTAPPEIAPSGAANSPVAPVM